MPHKDFIQFIAIFSQRLHSPEILIIDFQTECHSYYDRTLRVKVLFTSFDPKGHATKWNRKDCMHVGGKQYFNGSL